MSSATGISELDRLIASIVDAVDAERDVEPLVDLREAEPVIDLREPLPTRPRPHADPSLTIVLNRARYNTFGTRAVRPMTGGAGALAELADLLDHAPLPGVVDLVRQATERRTARESTSTLDQAIDGPA